MGKKDSLLQIDYRPRASSSSSVINNSTSSGVDTSLFLLRDGTQSMLANFDVGGFSITNVNLVDGIDIAAHAANPNAHHSRQHSYDSTSDHTGTLAWYNVNKTGSNINEIEVRLHNSLQSIGENDHHNRQHSITSALDHTVTGSNFDLVGLTATNTLGILTPSANVSSGIERILKSNSTGNLNLASLTTTLINSGSGATLEVAPGNYLVLNPAGYLIQLTSGRAIQSDNYSSQTTGMRIDHQGGGDFRYLYTDEMHAKAFIADLEQALAGGQIISKSVAVLYSDFTAPAAGGSTTLVVEDLPGTTAMAVFQNGDIVRLRNFSRSGGGLSITDCWGVVTLDTTYGTSGFDSNTKTQRYTFVRSSGSDAGAMATSTIVASKSLVLDYGTTGNGYYEVNAIDGAYAVNSPYAQVVNWTTHPATGKTTRARLGNLVGIFGGSNEYGLYAGDGGTATSSQYLRISNAGVGLFNVPLRMYTGGTETVHIAGWNDVWIGPNSSDKRLVWNGTTLTITGQVVIQSGSSGYSNLSGIPTSLADVNSTEGSKLSGIATGATKNTLYRQDSDPGGSNGDFWYDTDAVPPILYQKISGSWQIASNYITNTTQLTDGANLGKTANWNSVSSIPARLSNGDTPTGGAGLYLTPNYMGFWNGSLWRTYMNSSGSFVFRGGSGAYVAWDGTSLFGGTSSTFNTTTANWYVDSANGAFVAGAGQVYITKDAINLTWTGSYNGTNNYGQYSKIRWYLTPSTSSTLLLTAFVSDTPNIGYSSSLSPVSRQKSLILTGGDTNFTGLYLTNSTGSNYFQVYSFGIAFYNSFFFDVSSSGIQHRVSAAGARSGTLYMSSADLATITATTSVGDSWSNLSFGPGWTNYGGSGNTCQYRKFGNIVFVKGLAVLFSGTGTLVGTLPVGYRPSGSMLKASIASTGAARVDVTSAGAISVVSGVSTGMWLSIEFVFST